ncbi:MAG TPA: AraC family transcriptional regulator, partial [Gammaproteobacteria bacterium]
AEIADVAFLVGFNDPSYFGKIFRRYMDCSPSEFLESNQDAVDTDLLLADLDPRQSRSDSS